MSVILKPVISEKMTLLGDKLNRYAFIVDKKANKLEIKKAIEELYEVNVKAVNTCNYMGKKVTKYTKTGVISGRKSSKKKAIVTLADGEKIDFYSNI